MPSHSEMRDSVALIGTPCGPKPLMSSSGKGQSVTKNDADIEKAWTYAMDGSRGDLNEVIVEEFIAFDYEITLLTLTQKMEHLILSTYWTQTRTWRLPRKLAASKYAR